MENDNVFECERCGATHAIGHATDMLFRPNERVERVLEVCPSCKVDLAARGWVNAHVEGDSGLEGGEEPTQPPCECDGCFGDFDADALKPMMTTRVVRQGWDGYGYTTWLVCAECLPIYVGSGMWMEVAR